LDFLVENSGSKLSAWSKATVQMHLGTGIVQRTRARAGSARGVGGNAGTYLHIIAWEDASFPLTFASPPAPLLFVTSHDTSGNQVALVYTKTDTQVYKSAICTKV
jgi:hypothetical protein